MGKAKIKTSLRRKNLKQAKAIFSKATYREFNNGYHWQFYLGDTIYNFFPTTYKWHTSYDANRKMIQGVGIESFCKAIGYIYSPHGKILRTER